jgi:hypothetical protein
MERRLIVQEARQAFEDRLQDWRNALRVFDRMMHTFERAEKVKGQSNEVLLKAFILKDLDEFKKYTDQSKLEQVARTNIRRVIDYYFSDDETLKDFFRDKK